MISNEISQVVKSIVSNIDNKITGTYDSVSGKTTFCDTKWARKGKIISNAAGFNYKIDTIVYNEYILATQLDGVPNTPLDGVITLPEPFNLAGTKISTNNEWTISTPDISSKTPLIWLLKIISKTEYGREDTRLFTSDLRVFFLDETNPTDYYNDDHTEQVVYPMDRLCDSFLDSVKSNRQYQTIQDYSKTYFDRFGVERENGMFQNILDANLSGIQLQLSLTKYKTNCKC